MRLGRHEVRGVGVALLVALFGAACDPCGDLDQRICDDLEGDCAAWRSEIPAIRAGLLDENERRWRVRRSTCEAMASEGVYETRTLPVVRNAITRLRDPNAALIPVATGAPPNTGGGMWQYLGVVMILVVGAWTVVRHRGAKSEATSTTAGLADAQQRAAAELEEARRAAERRDDA